MWKKSYKYAIFLKNLSLSITELYMPNWKSDIDFFYSNKIIIDYTENYLASSTSRSLKEFLHTILHSSETKNMKINILVQGESVAERSGREVLYLNVPLLSRRSSLLATERERIGRRAGCCFRTLRVLTIETVQWSLPNNRIVTRK